MMTLAARLPLIRRLRAVRVAYARALVIRAAACAHADRSRISDATRRAGEARAAARAWRG